MQDDPQTLRKALDELCRQRRSRVWLLEMTVAPCLFAFHSAWTLPVVTTGQLGSCILIMALGGYLLFDARDRRRAQIQLREPSVLLAERAPELIEGIRQARKNGINVYDDLMREGISQSDLRRYLIDRARNEAS